MTEFASLALPDLSLFADLGTDAPRSASHGLSNVVHMVRNGRQIKLVFHPDGHIDERGEDSERRHLDLRALFASPNFGDLGRWADAQATHLRERVGREQIPIQGLLSGRQELAGSEVIDDILVPGDVANSPTLRIVLIDGPAGIGKTSLIRSIAYDRADKYKQIRRPLFLHVESRGRMLQNIMDLMAFSLQTLRLNVTYDQVPVLVRHGLIVLAIDGFDELGDPNGYELAWAQVNELVVGARGQGSILLAGRETFVGRDRLTSALQGFRPDSDDLYTFTLQPITPTLAKQWLKERGWTDSIFSQENVAPLFEPGSYALRPFFLVELAGEGVRDQVENGEVDDLMWFLVETMIDREATKFGDDVARVTSEEQRRNFVIRFLGEVARDLAENQTEAISNDSLMWIAELVAHETVTASLVGILKNRASVVAFLADDDRRGYKRFSHAQLLNHFLSRITVDAILESEIPKYVRRNIFGSEFLARFVDVTRHVAKDRLSTFAKRAISLISEYGDQDRTRRNLAAVVLATTSTLDADFNLVLVNVAIDEALIVETACPLTLESVIITQLDAREADLRAFSFGGNCHVISLIADAGTAVPIGFPHPQRVQLPERMLVDPTDIASWLAARSPHADDEISRIDQLPARVRKHDLFKLIGRIGRYRPFWLREGDHRGFDRGAERILDDPYWPKLRDTLIKHELVTVRDVQASGSGGRFFHVRRKSDLLAKSTDDPQIAAFFNDVVAAIG